MRLLVITGGGPEVGARVAEALAAGAEVLVREPAIPADIPLERVILHARMPGALERAWALHLASDMPVAQWRRRFHGRISCSAHGAEEAREKLDQGADDVLLSPIFAPRHGRPALGTAGLQGLFALGGVTTARLEACRAAGAVGVAVMGGVWSAPDGVGPAVGRYLQKLQTRSS